MASSPVPTPVVILPQPLPPELDLEQQCETRICIISRRATFSACHRLHAPSLSDDENVAVFGKCNNPHGHGHNYVLEVFLKGPVCI
jgi:hypothetical protein